MACASMGVENSNKSAGTTSYADESCVSTDCKTAAE